VAAVSTPIIEHIAVQLAAYIDSITEAAGYHQDLTAVRPKRIHLEGDLNADNMVLIVQERTERLAMTDTTITWRQRFALQALVIDSDRATAALDTRLNDVRDDIERKLNNPAYRKCGGYADGIVLQGAEMLYAEVDGPEMSGVAVYIDVVYSTQYDDPYTLAA
jgi:hypothetical protein